MIFTVEKYLKNRQINSVFAVEKKFKNADCLAGDLEHLRVFFDDKTITSVPSNHQFFLAK